MTTIKTPEQIADQIAAIHDMSGPESQSMWHLAIVEAIEADRAQRALEGSPLIAAVADALEDRGSLAAAQLIRDTDPEDDLWNNYVGPMLDSLEDDYTAIAKESAE